MGSNSPNLNQTIPIVYTLLIKGAKGNGLSTYSALEVPQSKGPNKDPQFLRHLNMICEPRASVIAEKAEWAAYTFLTFLGAESGALRLEEGVHSLNLL